MCLHACKYTQILHVSSHSVLIKFAYGSWQALWPAWWKLLLSWFLPIHSEGSDLPFQTTDPKGSPKLEWDKSTTEEAALDLAHFCCLLVPCAPPTGLFEQPQLVKWSLTWFGRNRALVLRNRFGTSMNRGSHEWTQLWWFAAIELNSIWLSVVAK